MFAVLLVSVPSPTTAQAALVTTDQVITDPGMGPRIAIKLIKQSLGHRVSRGGPETGYRDHQGVRPNPTVWTEYPVDHLPH